MDGVINEISLFFRGNGVRGNAPFEVMVLLTDSIYEPDLVRKFRLQCSMNKLVVLLVRFLTAC